MAVCPAEFTVITGMYVPAVTFPVAMNVNKPDGFVSEA